MVSIVSTTRTELTVSQFEVVMRKLFSVVMRKLSQNLKPCKTLKLFLYTQHLYKTLIKNLSVTKYYEQQFATMYFRTHLNIPPKIKQKQVKQVSKTEVYKMLTNMIKQIYGK